MGNYKFKLSDMMPNSWFYKLKDMRKLPPSTTTTRPLHHPKPFITPKQQHQHQPYTTPNRTSYYISSKDQHSTTTTTTTPSPAHPKASDTPFYFPSDNFNTTTLRPIKTKKAPAKPDVDFDCRHAMLRRAQRQNRALIKRRRTLMASKMMTRPHGLAESFVVVKSSEEPRRDFRESMVEMIVENEIRGVKEMEELLACYLALNLEEYHHLILNVFQEISMDLPNSCLHFNY